MVLIDFKDFIKEIGLKLAESGIEIRYKKISETAATIISDLSHTEHEDTVYKEIKAYIEANIFRYEEFIEYIFTGKLHSSNNNNFPKKFVLTVYIPSLVTSLRESILPGLAEESIAEILKRLSSLQPNDPKQVSSEQENALKKISVLNISFNSTVNLNNTNPLDVDPYEINELINTFKGNILKKQLINDSSAASQDSTDVSSFDDSSVESWDSADISSIDDSSVVQDSTNTSSNEPIHTSEITEVNISSISTTFDGASASFGIADNQDEFCNQYLSALKTHALKSTPVVKEHLLKESQRIPFRFQFNKFKSESTLHGVEIIDTETNFSVQIPLQIEQNNNNNCTTKRQVDQSPSSGPKKSKTAHDTSNFLAPPTFFYDNSSNNMDTDQGQSGSLGFEN